MQILPINELKAIYKYYISAAVLLSLVLSLTLLLSVRVDILSLSSVLITSALLAVTLRQRHLTAKVILDCEAFVSYSNEIQEHCEVELHNTESIAAILETVINQVYSIKTLGNDSVSGLTLQFSELRQALNNTIESARGSVENFGDDKHCFAKQSQEELNEVLHSLRVALGSKLEVVNSNQAVSHAAKELTEQTKSIQKISKEITLLSLNASIEAARAGEAGRGFAVVAERVRELSDITSEAAELIIEKMNGLTNAVADNTEKLTESQAQDVTLMDDAELHIRKVLNEMATVANELTQSVHGLDDTASKIKANVDDAITDFQFQDRVSQKLEHICKGLTSLVSLYRTEGELGEEGLAALQQEMFNSYTMKEERECHVSTTENTSQHDHVEDEVTFF
ncbi:chemotaxis protein [Pseudoalteromonas sp. HM-SA03]|uniref:methyl-accepting chemotaxis protein n=1 Tax=Pseudoalteromonas sp. HM-SA03 TaxID=2029678 RepID=UPI000BAE23BD|nr:methyl-accepting chemotaxis protein [Pseudoalteromonas sp. HM-SA03]PAY02867.1 chemotaxis protein [Pseudoalteromonas sp. HM-SA03]